VDELRKTGVEEEIRRSREGWGGIAKYEKNGRGTGSNMEL
jgi:hypothetical protein